MTKFLSWPFLIAAVSGITMAIQGTINSVLAQKTSLLPATLIVHIIGSIIAFAAVIATGASLAQIHWLDVPWYLYLGGVLSVIIIGLVAVSIPQIGVANATTAIIIGQVGTALIIDHFGWFGVQRLHWTLWQFLGLALFAAGAKLLFR